MLLCITSPVCRIEGFPTFEREKCHRLRRFDSLADMKVGGTAGWETCATLLAALLVSEKLILLEKLRDPSLLIDSTPLRQPQRG
jgi:hypothetical protein